MLHRRSKTLSPSSHDITREAEISTLSEKKNNLIGAHYAPHTHTHAFEKLMIPKHSGPPVPPNDVGKERSATKTAFSRESSTHLQTTFMVYCFPSCPLWMLSKLSLCYDRVRYADAGQDAFSDAPPRDSLFLSVILEKWLPDKDTTPSISQ